MSDKSNNSVVRILIIYYSQSGETARVVEALAAPLQATANLEVVCLRLESNIPYPYPWRSLSRFFGVLPQCHLGPLPALAPLCLDLQQTFDLIVLAYPVWFLAPAPPVQRFLQEYGDRLLHGRRVLLVSVSRQLWYSAAQHLKQLLRQAGARLSDQIAVTHQGPVWATFLTTPRALLFGRKAGGRFLPPAGVGPSELERLTHLGQVLAERAARLRDPEVLSLLSDQKTSFVDRRYLLAERLGWYWFRAGAYLLHELERLGPWAQRVGIYLFVFMLVGLIVLGLPVLLGVQKLLSWFLRRWLEDAVQRLRTP